MSENPWYDYVVQRPLVTPTVQYIKTGSDVLKVISMFINNTQVPICGSRIFILLKRSPNEQDITELVAQMRKYRVYVYIVASSMSSGGFHPETIRSLTTQTNGWDIHYGDSSYISDIAFYSPFFYSDNLIYAANVNLSPNGSIALPKMTVPRHEKIGYLNNNNFASKVINLNAAVYEVQLDYEISNDVIYAVQIRIYTLG
ncbi:hypothetical protein GCK72_012413 [Caenorhabditis remanei]|uniref:Uncharacterized protein n=1 Tax=Caenorhabditis remanei TaxID=31234 RepID=A0A6A5GKY9_CAERE|nr:hypothetical protein GCK72_012413 [Caenorhabditis remanei]KAF1755960.1 hypothetical protein GCK72_012413 [Caenorhabditis remanei]